MSSDFLLPEFKFYEFREKFTLPIVVNYYSHDFI